MGAESSGARPLGVIVPTPDIGSFITLRVWAQFNTPSGVPFVEGLRTIRKVEAVVRDPLGRASPVAPPYLNMDG